MPSGSSPFRDAAQTIHAETRPWSALLPITQQRLRLACDHPEQYALAWAPSWEARLPRAGAAVAALALGLTLGLASGEATRTQLFFDHPDPLRTLLIGLTLAAATSAALVALSAWLYRRKTGVIPGTYLFPRDLLVIQRGTLQRFPVETIEGISREGAGHRIHLRGGGGITLPDREEEPVALEQRLREAHQEAESWEGTPSEENHDPLAAERARKPRTSPLPDHLSRFVLIACTLTVALQVSFPAARWLSLQRARRSDQKLIEGFSLETGDRFASALQEAHRRGAAWHIQRIEERWLMLLATRKHRPDSAAHAVAYLKAGGQDIDTLVQLLEQSTYKSEHQETYEQLLTWLGEHHEAAAIKLLRYLETQHPAGEPPWSPYRSLHWHRALAARSPGHRERLAMRMVQAAARPPFDIPMLLTLAGVRPRGPQEAPDGWPAPEASPAVQKASREALDTIYQKASQELEQRDLSPPVKAGFARLLARAKEGTSSAMFIGATDRSSRLGHPLRDTGGALCAEMQVTVLTPTILDAIFFDPIVASHHHGGAGCKFAQEHPEGASVVLRCGGKEGPPEEFSLHECSLEFPGDPPILAGARFDPPLLFKPFRFRIVQSREYLERPAPLPAGDPLAEQRREVEQVLPEVHAHNQALWRALRHATPKRR
jgi:hypothetical protein